MPATTLRFYETAGLLSAERTPSGYRVYGEDAVERLAFISYKEAAAGESGESESVFGIPAESAGTVAVVAAVSVLLGRRWTA